VLLIGGWQHQEREGNAYKTRRRWSNGKIRKGVVMVEQGERGVMATKLRSSGGGDGRSGNTTSESQEQGARITRMKVKSNGNKST
jgi:hypothetical protein